MLDCFLILAVIHEEDALFGVVARRYARGRDDLLAREHMLQPSLPVVVDWGSDEAHGSELEEELLVEVKGHVVCVGFEPLGNDIGCAADGEREDARREHRWKRHGEGETGRIAKRD